MPHKLGLLERLFGKRLAKSGTGWVCCANGVVWKLDLSDLMHRWIVYGDYEGSSRLDWVRGWLGTGGNVIDSGANIGQMLLYMAPITGVKIFAFEPLQAANYWINECLKRQTGWQVELYSVGLSDKSTTAVVQVDGPRTTLRQDWYQGKNLETTEVQLERLDQLMKPEMTGSIRLWKLDVEGHEIEALQGAEGLLKKQKIEAIYIEVSRGQYQQVQQLLASLGYELFAFRGRGLLDKVFRPPEGTTELVAMPASY